MLYCNFETIQGHKVDRPFERELKILMSPSSDERITDFTLLLSTLAPNGGSTDMHAHEDGGELMIFMTGHGKAWIEDKEFELKPGVSIYAPPGVPHKTLNTGDEPLKIACVFIPAVDEEYVRANIEAAQKAAGGSEQ